MQLLLDHIHLLWTFQATTVTKKLLNAGWQNVSGYS